MAEGTDLRIQLRVGIRRTDSRPEFGALLWADKRATFGSPLDRASVEQPTYFLRGSIGEHLGRI